VSAFVTRAATIGRVPPEPPPVVDFYDRHPINEGQVLEALRLLAKALDLPISRLRIVSGQQARLKTIRIKTASADEIRARLSGILNLLNR
jgi:hypothetical protein